MLLQKTGSRIKQLIINRRRNSFEDAGDIIEDDSFVDRKLSQNTRRLSWLSQSPSADFTALRRRSSSATTRSRPLPPTSSNASSSESSLCSCDCNTYPVSFEHSLSTPEPKPHSSEILYLPPLSSSRPRGDAKTWRLIFSESSSPSPSPSPASSPSDTDVQASAFANARVSTFDLLEALSMDPMDEDVTPRQSIKSLEISDMDDISGDVDKLIRETDEAFQAVGNALEEAKAATQGWWESTPAKRPVILPRVMMKNGARFPVSPLSKSPLSRSVSVAKRKTPVKKRMNILGRALRAVPAPTSNTPARWTLTDVTTNVVDVFSGKMFRTEVDEMLTPGRIQRMKEQKGLEMERRISEESARTIATDGSTPTEPFHLESLSSRIDAAQAQSSPLPSPVLPPPATPKALQDIRGKAGNSRFTKPSTPPGSMVIDDLTFPSPPRPTRNRSNSQHIAPLLPTIPEVSPLTLLPNRNPPLASNFPLAKLQSTPDHVFLPSTSFSLTSPGFRHGPIRLERILLRAQEMSPEPEEDKLDWTAFQMAIQGTMNDMSSTNDADDEWEADESALDDIISWWEGFDFQGFGQMIQDAPTRTRVKYERKVRPWRADVAEKIAVEQEMGFTREIGDEGLYIQDEVYGTGISGLELDTSAMKITDVEKERAHESLPSSPMVELGAHDGGRDDEAPIPMGFNLGHDLGDFLTWETEHVRAASINR